jgi:hypothetical protein
MKDSPSSGHTGPAFSLGEGLFGAGIRRDITDLNRQFLDLSLDPALEGDLRFQVSAAIRENLAGCPAEARSRMAACPFSLFQLALPGVGPGGPGFHPSRIADAHRSMAPPAKWERGRDFALLTLSVARQLAGNLPVVSRLAIGLVPADATRLLAMGPSELAALAEWPGLVRPRWAWHERYWGLLAAAARLDDGGTVLGRAYALGLCLPESPVAAQPVAAPPAQHGRQSRPRGGSGRRFPC